MMNWGIRSMIIRTKIPQTSETATARKTMHTNYGDMDINILRDRNGEYEPKVIKKY